MKSAVILSGRHEPTDDRYPPIERMFKEAGWEQTQLFVSDWEQHRVTQLVDEFVRAVPEDSRPLTLCGFSLGAMIALIASTKVEVDTLILCSPSGYFKEYAPLLPADDLAWAKEHLSDFEQYSAHEVIGRSKAKLGYVIAGEKELGGWPEFKEWVEELQALSGWPLTIVPDVSHEIEAPAYQHAIQLAVGATRDKVRV